jgi:hypothetical protein
MNMRTMNMQSERDQRQLLEALRSTGVPISARTRLINVPIDLEEERDLLADEQVAAAVAAQETRRRTYESLKAEGLPIPEDLLNDFQPVAKVSEAPPKGTPEVQLALPNIGMDEPADTEALAPVDSLNPAGGDPTKKTLPQNRWMEQGNPSRPPQSDERREGMPMAASLTKEGVVYVPMERVFIDPAASKVLALAA